MKTYLSITSIFQNQDILIPTLKSISNQSIKPEKCYIYLSEEPYLKDLGFKNKIISDNLSKFIQNNNTIFEIKWCKNTGSYRKLLPLLQEKWEEDCIIITIDDDTEYDKDLIKNYLNDYNKHKCCINYRGFTMKFSNSLTEIKYLIRENKREKYLYNFLTGKGGALYQPSFFKKTEDLIFREDLFSSLCPTGDDIWFNFVRICNSIELYIPDIKFMNKDLTKNETALAVNYNCSNVDLNTINIVKTVKELINLGYLKDTTYSEQYWNYRYNSGGNSGAGSYGKLAQFKADIINNFVKENNIKSMLDFGVGDGNQLSLLKVSKYIGLDISQNVIVKCKNKYSNDINKSFYLCDEYNKTLDNKIDLSISCDVLYHLIEDGIYREYLFNLFKYSDKYVIIYARNENYNHTTHVKFRKFTDYIQKEFPKWELIKHIPNKYPQLPIGSNNENTSPSDFYIYRKRKDNCIITLNNGGRKYLFYTKKLMELYSEKCNSDFKVITDYKKDFDIEIGRSNNKSYLYKMLVIDEYLKYYEKVLFIDDTCCINKNTPNIFELTDENSISGFNEGIYTNLNSVNFDKNFIFEHKNFTIDCDKYLNTGVLCVPKNLSYLFNIENIIKNKDLFLSSYVDQCYLNYVLQYNNINIKTLSVKFNNIFLNNFESFKRDEIETLNEDYIKEQYIMHISGYYQNDIRIRYIQKICEFFY